ncbi:unnamed protein product [Cyprideis torosa]|uniref:Uncharacterized protein n=1 Tax=Cyprideis torosa TaxID=163714 RepID=A0A7R8ZNX3_9CRUS|nr:unnamed protein product [Cyprideis torosa]CAG0899058.1 unnamed protein product [Cyprideis torosa]
MPMKVTSYQNMMRSATLQKLVRSSKGGSNGKKERSRSSKRVAQPGCLSTGAEAAVNCPRKVFVRVGLCPVIQISRKRGIQRVLLPEWERRPTQSSIGCLAITKQRFGFEESELQPTHPDLMRDFHA